MKKAAFAFILVLIVMASGCVSQSGPSQTSTTTSSAAGGIDFGSYEKGGVLAQWKSLADVSKVYVSEGYEDMAKHYFPNAQILPASQYDGGVAILSPADARSLLRGKPILITVSDYFGYVVYKLGLKFVGPDKGVFAAFNKDGKPYFVFTGTSKAGAGAAVEYALELAGGKAPDAEDVLRSGEFEGVVLKVIGDNDWNGIPDDGEHWYLDSFKTREPFIYYWRIVDGENVTVNGGFIRLVNGSTVYIHALGFNVSVDVKDSKNVELTYVIENVNPSVLELPAGAETGDTWVKLSTSEASFDIVPKELKDYKMIAFGDHRSDGGKEPPKVFLKIRDEINSDDALFIIDGGDLVYSGKVDEWAALLKEWKWNKPIFLAPGNHEYRGEGVNVYHTFFGPDDYSFALGDYYYIFINDVENDYGLSDEVFTWLEGELERAKDSGKRPVLVLHAPPVDPRPEGDHAMNPEDGKRLLALMKEYNAFGIFSHIHIYWYGEEDGVQMLITGGGGAPLYASPDQGGFYHYVRLSMGADGNIGVEPVKVSP
ncbi:metallophosphoesterase family protein [Thermococcus radiotolerans]|uniref:Phosphoesterase n=1 Tax=Thermococcus radiotolerans TaxID=187880 RepID=A0A2Z2MZX0_9EURY|nr:metallophosphoesterase [Thermococcus radiotolerans]ASJ15091.1 phosphoesterase [Thermococcus radiotolerans]